MADESEEVMSVIAETLDDVVRQGFAWCRLCHTKIYGEDLDEILRGLGEHEENGLCLTSN